MSFADDAVRLGDIGFGSGADHERARVTRVTRVTAARVIARIRSGVALRSDSTGRR